MNLGGVVELLMFDSCSFNETLLGWTQMTTLNVLFCFRDVQLSF